MAKESNHISAPSRGMKYSISTSLSASMALVGRVLTATEFANSRLYDPEFTHRFRKGESAVKKQGEMRAD